jgi:hypothetical protein
MAAVFVESDPVPQPRDVLGTEPVAEPKADPFAAAFRQDNSVVSVLTAMRRTGPFAPVQDYNPIDDIKDTPYFQTHPYQFAASRSPAETQSIMRRINQEDADKRALANAGALGTVATLAAGALDPTMLLGGLGPRSAALSSTFLTGARDVAAFTAKSLTAQEFALGTSQQTRSGVESLEAIASGTLLWGFIGGAASKLLGREGRLDAVTKAVDADRAWITRHAEGIEQPPPVPAPAAEVPPVRAPVAAEVPPAPAPAPAPAVPLAAAEVPPERVVNVAVRSGDAIQPFDRQSFIEATMKGPQETAEYARSANMTDEQVRAEIYKAGDSNQTSEARYQRYLAAKSVPSERAAEAPVAEVAAARAPEVVALVEPPITTVTPEGTRAVVQPEVVAPLPPKAKQRGPRRSSRDPETFSLFEYLASRGGLAPSPELAKIFDKNQFVPGFGQLIRKTGMSLDRAWEAVTRDSKYLFDASDRAGLEAKTTSNDLLRLIEEEARGNKQYQAGIVPTKGKAQLAHEAEANRNQIERELDRHIAEAGYGEVDPKLHERTVQLMEKEGVRDPEVALERAVMEDADHYEQLAQRRTESIGDIPGWDAAEPRAAPEAGRSLQQPGPGLEPGSGGEGGPIGEAARGPGPREISAEPGVEGKPQLVIPGAERISEAELAQRRADERLKPAKAQRPMDEGLFGEGHKQTEMFRGGGSVGAAATDTRKVELAPSFGVAGLLSGTNPMARLLSSASVWARRTAVDLAETPLITQENIQGIPNSNGPALDRLARMTINQSRVAVGDTLDRLWKELRFAGNQAPWFARMRDELGMLDRPPELPTFAEFKALVADANRNNDTHVIPQVQEAAQFVRNNIFEPWKDRAVVAGLLPEGVEVKTADSYLMRVYNKQAIMAKRPEFVDRVTSWLKSDQATKADIQQRLDLYQGALESHEATIEKMTGRLERRRASLEEAEIKQEEVQRFNKFAFQRSEKLSKPLDELRQQIAGVTDKVQPELDKLAQLAEDIKAERVKFPEIKEADALLFKMIGAAQKLKQSKGIIDAVDAAGEYVDAVDKVISGFKGGIREAAEQAKVARRDLAPDLVALEKSRAEVKKEAEPYLKQLNQLRKTLAEERAARIEGARGGAVFETKIRDRGNVIADALSGKRAEIDELESKLTNEHASAAAVRAKIEEEIGKWEGKSAAEAKSALKARDKYEAERAAKAAAKGEAAPTTRLTSADAAIDRTVKRILESHRDLSDPELRDLAQEITGRVLGTPDGRLPYDLAQGGPDLGYRPGGGEPPRGPLAAREFNIPDDMIKEFMENDIEHVVNAHLRTMVPDVLLTERFGDTRMTEALKKIDEEYARLTDAAGSEKERTALGKERDAALRDVAGIRDRIRGVYGQDVFNSMRGAGRVAAAVKNLNVLTSMGMAAVSSLPDMAGAVFRFGLGTTFNDAWAPFVSSLMGNRELTREAFRQFRAMGISIETVTSQRAHALSDIMDSYRPQSRLERSLQWGADRFQLVNMLGPWTDIQKTIAATVASQEIFRAAEASAKGAASERQLRLLGESNIDQHMAVKIAEQYAASGNIVDGVHLPNTEAWTDTTARQAFEGAVGREVDIAVITPGQEKPLWLSNPVVSVLGQFKSFTAASTERILVANLQRRDAQVMQGLIASLGLGMVSYKVNAMLGGQPTSDRPQDWIKEAISRGGVLGWFEEGNALASKMTRGGVDIYRLIGADKPLSRYAGRSVLDQMLGPTAGKIEALSKITGAAGTLEWNQSDTSALRKITAFQNVFYLRGLFNQVEAGANNAFGIPMKPTP